MHLAHRIDRRTLAYLGLHVGLAGVNWLAGGLWLLAVLSAILAVGITNVAHNHAHVPMWREAHANRATDVVLSALMGIPVLVFPASHIAMHHRRLRRGRDLTHPSRFGTGNHLIGLLLHPLMVLPAVVPGLLAYAFRRLNQSGPRRHQVIAQCMAPAILALPVAMIDASLWCKVVLIPQLAGLHMLLAANYLQHAHARPSDPGAHSRTFLGAVNLLWFNIGYHHVHHEHPRAHWSDLPSLHRACAHRIDPHLIEPGLIGYVVRVLVIAPLGRISAGSAG